MNKQINIMALIRNKIGVIILGGVLLGALSFLFLVVSQRNFKVSTSYLISQNQTGTQDFYTLSKSAEYIGKVLGEGIGSELFISEVQQTGKVNQEFLPFDKKEKINAWSDMVRVNRNAELGIIEVVTFNNDQREALLISQAISDVITTKSNIFLGDGQSVTIKILSGPVLEKNPSFLNIVFAVTGGIIFGLLLMIIVIYYKTINKPNSASFDLKGLGTIEFHDKPESTKLQMEQSGIFMNNGYQENYFQTKS